ncbi:hypothetical protein SAMN02745716_0537 [Thermoleophilum album]|uniref:Uncharacterized protein n=1 Tax=Thermoleophilum album TaxID=29539 RepID=A0A1H6FIT1_THEAL|nr:hypothetical protein SAMN02745716_0537 [Thermoleophilum album]
MPQQTPERAQPVAHLLRPQRTLPLLPVELRQVEVIPRDRVHLGYWVGDLCEQGCELPLESVQ